MFPSWDNDTILTEVVGNFFDVEDGVIHLTELLFSIPVIGSGLGVLFHPLVTVFALTMMLSVGDV